jgi:ribosomal-protein-alanine N-acetyltransferase
MNAEPSMNFIPMTLEQLDWVVAQEQRLHASPWSQGNFRDALEAGYDCWIMEAHQHAIGYAVVLRVLDEAHLLTIGISPEHQRRGHGTRFMTFLAQNARQLSVTQMFLEVRVSNLAARTMYARLGFEEIGQRARYYPAPDGGREDAIVMRWSWS